MRGMGLRDSSRPRDGGIRYQGLWKGYIRVAFRCNTEGTSFLSHSRAGPTQPLPISSQLSKCVVPWVPTFRPMSRHDS